MLKNATALITGGAQGLGKGFAKTILQLGGRVSLLDVQASTGIDAQNELNKQFGTGTTLFIKCDVRKKQELEDAFRTTKSVFGGIDIVVNNAGVSTVGGDWERTIDINLTAVLRGCFLAADYMSVKNGGRGGQIINIASSAGLTAVPFDVAYAASKHGVVGLSRSLALMLEKSSIKVNCLCPSFTDTQIVQSALGTPQDGDNLVFKQTVQAVGLMKIDDVVAAFKLLLEAENKTGAVMYVTPKGVGYRHPGQATSRL